jgi:hypothetical protein
VWHQDAADLADDVLLSQSLVDDVFAESTLSDDVLLSQLLAESSGLVVKTDH